MNAWVGWTQGLSPATKEAYAKDMRHISKAAGVTTTEETVLALLKGKQEVNAIIGSCLQQWEGLSPNTINRRLAVIKTVLRWAHDNDHIPWNVRIPMRKRALVTNTAGPSAHEAMRLLFYLEYSGSLRDQALCACLLLCGMRCSEALSLRPRDIGDEYAFPIGKGLARGRRKVALQPEALSLIRSHADTVKQDDKLFPFSASRARAIVTGWGEHVGLRGLHAHGLRHSFATIAHDGGASVIDIAAALGNTPEVAARCYIDQKDAARREVAKAVWRGLSTGRQAERRLSATLLKAV